VPIKRKIKKSKIKNQREDQNNQSANQRQNQEINKLKGKNTKIEGQIKGKIEKSKAKSKNPMAKQQSIKGLIENKREVKVENVPKVDKNEKFCDSKKTNSKTRATGFRYKGKKEGTQTLD